MKIVSSSFVISAVSESQFPPEPMPEIAFAGRSNVGKSSLINKLLGRKNLAHVGAAPGKTRQVNFYLVNNAFRFVDLPGFGYASVSRHERDLWKKMIESYFGQKRFLKGCIHLIDARHAGMESDRVLERYLKELNIPSMLVATKADKLGQKEMHSSKKEILENFNEEAFFFSAATGCGCEELWNVIEQWIC